MSTQTVQLIDESRNTMATVLVVDEGKHYGGTINLTHTSADVRTLFEDFEEIVNGQMFSLLDDIQEKISALRIKAVFKDGCEAYVKDLQVFPSTGDVSFTLAEVSAQGTESA